MSRNLRRGAVAALPALIAALSTSCAASNDSQTSRIVPNNVNANIGAMKLRNITLVTGPGGGGGAAVTAYLVNEGGATDTLKSITVQGGGPASFGSAAKGGTVALPPGRPVLLGGPGQPTVTTSAAVEPGTYRLVTFDFARAGRGTVNTYVVPGTGAYSSFAPSGGGAGSASPAPSPTGTVTLAPKGGVPTAEQSARPSETAAGGASPARGSASP